MFTSKNVTRVLHRRCSLEIHASPSWLPAPGDSPLIEYKAVSCLDWARYVKALGSVPLKFVKGVF